jgi:heptosyltransferase-3
VAPKFRPGFWEKSFTHLYPAQSHPDRHTVDTNLDSLRALGIQPNAARHARHPGTRRAAEARVEQLLAAHGLVAGRYIHVHPASRWGFKCWPAERVAALCDELAARGWPLVLTSAPDAKERELLAAVAAARRPGTAPALDLSGQLSLKELAALAARAQGSLSVSIRRRCTSRPRWARPPSASSVPRGIANGAPGARDIAWSPP